MVLASHNEIHSRLFCLDFVNTCSISFTLGKTVHSSAKNRNSSDGRSSLPAVFVVAINAVDQTLIVDWHPRPWRLYSASSHAIFIRLLVKRMLLDYLTSLLLERYKCGQHPKIITLPASQQ